MVRGIGVAESVSTSCSRMFFELLFVLHAKALPVDNYLDPDHVTTSAENNLCVPTSTSTVCPQIPRFSLLGRCDRTRKHATFKSNGANREKNVS